MAWHSHVSMELLTASTNSPSDVFHSNHLDEFYKHLPIAHQTFDLETIGQEHCTARSNLSSSLSKSISETGGDGELIT
jgi:hypothetical protein